MSLLSTCGAGCRFTDGCPAGCRQGNLSNPVYTAPHMGWQCPKCGRGNAPFVSQCPCGPSYTSWASAGTAEIPTGSIPVPLFDCHFDGDWKKCDKEMCAIEGVCRRRTSGSNAAPLPEGKE